MKKLFKTMVKTSVFSACFLVMRALADGDASEFDPVRQSTDKGANVNPNLPRIEILATDAYALKGTSTAAFTIIREGGADKELKVPYTIGGTASNGVDYVFIKDHLAIPAGYLAADILIEPKTDSPNFGNRTIVLSLQTSEAYHLVKRKRAVVTIVEDLYNDQVPQVTLTSPKEGDLFTLPCIVTITATATDPDGAVKEVAFYDGNRHLGVVTNNPVTPLSEFTLLWTNPPTGGHTLFARAEDAAGKSTLSSAVKIVVTNKAPVVKLISPTDGGEVPVNTDVEVKVEATDPDGKIQAVKVYGDGRLLATLTQGSLNSYTYTWEKPSLGKHEVKVVAEDMFGLSTQAEVDFTVANAAPEVKLTNPTVDQEFKAHSDIIIEATASDADGAVARVAFWANQRYLGSVKQAPYKLTWEKVPAGNYTLRAIAIDEYGQTTTSAPVPIKVKKN